jgi:L-ribulose-5-phosphate 3-epimerase
MPTHLTRRRFLAMAAATGLTAAGHLRADSFQTTLHKALIGAADEARLTSWKEAGFDGMESTNWEATPAEAAEARKMAERLGMRIHAVLRGWVNFNSPDPSVVAKDVESVETAIQAAEGYGADAVLLVPCRVGGMAMPDPWDFDIEFDEQTGHVTRVAAGDNAPYREYIEAQNHATDSSRKAVGKLIPAAEKAGVVIALENVWNNLWVKPALLTNFIASFQSPWVRCYYDIGNHVKYAPSEEWIRTVGKLIVKVHVKDFKVDRGHPSGGTFVDIRDGDVDWPLVRQALDKIAYNGWMTIEGSDGLSIGEQSERLDLIIAGK